MTSHESLVRTTFCLLLSCLLGLLSTAVSADTSRLVSDALPIALGDTLRGAALAPGEPECFRLETPSAGLLMLEVAVPGDAEVEPLLGWLASGCGRAPAVIERSASHLQGGRLQRAAPARGTAPRPGKGGRDTSVRSLP